MRIMLVTEPSGGGSGRHVIDLARGLIQAGHEVGLVYSPTRAEARFEREASCLDLLFLERLPMERSVGPSDIASARQLRRLIDLHGPFDVLHAHSSKAGALMRLVAPKSSASIYTPHALRTMDPHLGLAGRVIYGGIELLLAYAATDAVIAVAPEEMAHIRKLRMPGGKLHTVHNGVSPAAAVDRDAVRQELGLKPDDVAVVFVGRFCDQKDPLRFVESIKLAAQQNPRVKGVMLGDGELQGMIEEQLPSNIKIISHRNAREYLPAADIFCMTSRYEAMPYVLLEALSAGLPIVSTRVGGTTSTVSPGDNGIVVSADAPADDISAALLALSSQETRDGMGKRSQELASKFSLEAMIAATEAVYHAAAKSGPSRA